MRVWAILLNLAYGVFLAVTMAIHAKGIHPTGWLLMGGGLFTIVISVSYMSFKSAPKAVKCRPNKESIISLWLDVKRAELKKRLDD